MNKPEIVDLASQLQGSVQFPGDPEYDKARTVWNAMIDRRPALIARGVCVADVAAGVRFARTHVCSFR